jgi:hypothetical protein
VGCGGDEPPAKRFINDVLPDPSTPITSSVTLRLRQDKDQQQDMNRWLKSTLPWSSLMRTGPSYQIAFEFGDVLLYRESPSRSDKFKPSNVPT